MSTSSKTSAVLKKDFPILGTFASVRDRRNMRVFGITGGIGMGKSTVSSMVEKRGVEVVDTDQLARVVVQPGDPALAEIEGLFGAGVIAPEGALNRQELARRVFGSEVSRKQLEAILHPRIRSLWKEQIDQWRATNTQSGAVVIPLLYETRSEKNFDFVICVACGAETQKQRLLARKMSEEQIQQRIDAQLPIAEKMEKADYVIWNEGDLRLVEEQLDKIFKEMEV